MKNWFLLLLVLPLIAFSCRKDMDEITTTTTHHIPEIRVTASLSGQVINIDGEAIANAIVRVGSHAAVTNDAGIYQFQNIVMNARGTYITVSQAGYFHGSDRIYPANGSRNVSTIALLPKTNVGTVDGSQGGEVSVAGATIKFPSNSIANSQGQLIDGDVKVAARWLNPTADNLGDFMPGGLYGFDKDGREVVMTSMGMLAVELTDANGNEVNVANGRTAELRFPVPAELLSSAPETIPLWYFDEADGIWLEEGSARLEGDFYVGEVSHFSYWNVDIPAGTEVVFISGCLVQVDGSPAAYQNFHLSYTPDDWHIGYGATGGLGEFSGLVPANEIITFEFYDNCGLYTTVQVGPFAEDTNLDECLVISASDLITISGQLVGCNGLGVDGGLIQFSFSEGWNNHMVMADEDGNFSYSITDCSGGDISLVGFDIANLESTGDLNYTFTEDLDIDVITACDNPLEEYIDSNNDGRNDYFFDVDIFVDTIIFGPDSLMPASNFTVITSNILSDQEERSFISLYVSDIAEGSYTGEDAGYDFSYWSPDPAVPGFSLNCLIPCETVTINITNNEGPGGFLEGDYSGTSDGYDSMQLPVTDRPVSGTFRVRLPE